jgi:hypothetical protein
VILRVSVTIDPDVGGELDMNNPIARNPVNRRRGFGAEIIELYARWC